MKLFDTSVAPNPRRVRIFAAEKGIHLDLVQVDITKGTNREPGFLAKNPMGKVPVLELDDGRYLCESLAICEYLEELQPEPSLIGRTVDERANVRMWERRMEHEVMRYLLGAFVHSSPFFEGRFTQVREYAEACREDLAARLGWLDGVMGEREFVAGDAYSVADITLFCTLDFGDLVGEKYDGDVLTSIARWHKAMRARPSSEA